MLSVQAEVLLNKAEHLPHSVYRLTVDTGQQNRPMQRYIAEKVDLVVLLDRQMLVTMEVVEVPILAVEEPVMVDKARELRRESLPNLLVPFIQEVAAAMMANQGQEEGNGALPVPRIRVAVAEETNPAAPAS